MVETKIHRAAVALGCMNFGKRTPEAEAERIVARAVERGVTVFDTANFYNDGASERILGRALERHAGPFTIATKVGLARVNGRPEGLSPATIRRAIDGSLERLGVERVSVYYLHMPDHQTPIEETLAAIEEIRAAGKIERFAVSNYAAWQILEMMQWCDARKVPRPVMSQVMYNLLIRQIEIEYVAFTRRHPIHTTVFNPLAGGLLTGRHRRTRETEKGSRFEKNAVYQNRYWSDAFFDRVEEYGKVAAEAGMSLVDLSYAWLSGLEHVDSILVGPGSLEHLDAALDGCAKALPDDVRRRVDAIFRAAAGTDASYVR